MAEECQTSASPVYGVASNLHWGGVVGERAGYGQRHVPESGTTTEIACGSW